MQMLAGSEFNPDVVGAKSKECALTDLMWSKQS